MISTAAAFGSPGQDYSTFVSALYRHSENLHYPKELTTQLIQKTKGRSRSKSSSTHFLQNGKPRETLWPDKKALRRQSRQSKVHPKEPFQSFNLPQATVRAGSRQREKPASAHRPRFIWKRPENMQIPLNCSHLPPLRLPPNILLPSSKSSQPRGKGARRG